MDGQNKATLSGTNPSPMDTQTQNQQLIKYAGFWVRFAAYSFDALIVSAAINLLQLLFGFAGISIAPFNLGFFVAIFVGIVAVGFYYIFLTYKYQATFGKMILGLKVVSANLERPSLGRIFVREIPAKVISGAILYIGFIMAGFNKRKQALHDSIAKTVVVYKDPSKSVAREAAALAVGSLAASFLIGFLFSKIPVVKQMANTKALPVWDHIVNANVLSAGLELENYYTDHDNYVGFSIQNTAAKDIVKDINEQGCKASMKIDISPDGKNFVVHQPLCSDPQKSACYENGFSDTIIADTSTVGKNYGCK